MAAPTKQEPAGLLIRGLAVTLDALIIFPVSVLLASVLKDNLPMHAIVSLIISGTYYVMFLSGPWAATPGKRLMGLLVLRSDGSRLSAEQALQRYLAYIMPSLPVYSSMEIGTSSIVMLWLSLVWFAPVLFTEKRTGIHDMLCHTRVVHGKIEG